jgi:hypothetical protein
MFVTVLAIVIPLRVERLQNALLPMLTTVYPPRVEGIFTDLLPDDGSPVMA